MTELTNIWIEETPALFGGTTKTIRLDWDNDRHQRIAIKGSSPKEVLRAFDEMHRLLEADIFKGNL